MSDVKVETLKLVKLLLEESMEEVVIYTQAQWQNGPRSEPRSAMASTPAPYGRGSAIKSTVAWSVSLNWTVRRNGEKLQRAVGLGVMT